MDPKSGEDITKYLGTFSTQYNSHIPADLRYEDILSVRVGKAR